MLPQMSDSRSTQMAVGSAAKPSALTGRLIKSRRTYGLIPYLAIKFLSLISVSASGRFALAVRRSLGFRAVLRAFLAAGVG
jgi:hypothetical protein